MNLFPKETITVLQPLILPIQTFYYQLKKNIKSKYLQNILSKPVFSFSAVYRYSLSNKTYQYPQKASFKKYTG